MAYIKGFRRRRGFIKKIRLQIGLGNRVFKLAIIGSLTFFVLFFLSIIVSMACYTDLQRLISALVSDEIIFAIKLSVITATVATVFCVIIAVPAAYAMSRLKFRGKDTVDTILDLPIVMPPISLGAALLVFFNTPVGVAIESNLTRFVFEQPGLVLAQFTVISALAIRLMKATFDGISPRYEDVARTLGYTKLQAFFKVTLPLARNGLVAAIILAWARAIGEYGASVTLAGATRMKTETLPIAIFLSLATANVEEAVAVFLILISIAIAVLLLMRKVAGRPPMI